MYIKTKIIKDKSVFEIKKISVEEINLILDGLHDTLYRLKYDDKVDEDYVGYASKITRLRRMIEKELNK